MSANWIELSELSTRLRAEGKTKEALVCLQKAIRMASGANPLDIAKLKNRLANLLLLHDEAKAAEMAARETLAIEFEHGDCGRHTTNLADYYVMLARALEHQNRFREATGYVEKSIAIFSRLFAPDHECTRAARQYQESLIENTWRG